MLIAEIVPQHRRSRPRWPVRKAWARLSSARVSESDQAAGANAVKRRRSTRITRSRDDRRPAPPARPHHASVLRTGRHAAAVWWPNRGSGPLPWERVWRHAAPR